MDESETKRRLDSYSPKDKPIVEHIDAALDAYEAYRALDHQLAVQGTANAVIELRKAENGYDAGNVPA